MDDFKDKIADFENSDSNNFFLFLRENRILASILFSNYMELQKLLRHHNTAIEKRQFWSDSRFRLKLQIKIIRVLSNYLGSIFTVVEYSRRSIIKELENNEEIFALYKIKRNDFLKSSNHKFIQELRNHTSHNSYLKIGSQIIYDIEWTMPKKVIFLNKKHLLNSKDWSSEIEKYIESFEDKIYLNKILEDHYHEFIKFQNWIFLQLFVIDPRRTQKCINDLKDILELAKKYKATDQIIFNSSFIRFLESCFAKVAR